MRLLAVTLAILVLFGAPAEAGQPNNIRLDPNGISLIYPVMDSSGWLLTQPDRGDIYAHPGGGRITHWSDDYYSQDWARSCGATYGQRVYAGISGVIVWAGSRGPYGNTVAIYDQESGFALKYSHLSEISVAEGEYVLAGKSLVGRVGDTGNIQSTGCSDHPGAHLHLSLFKNVTNPAGRPISVTVVTAGGAPTSYAAPFGYTASVELAKAENDPTVYVMYYGTRVPVSASSFESHGWNFDKHRTVFDPLRGRIISGADLARVPTAYYFWPLRDYALLKSSNSQTVYQFEDGRKSALSYNVFMCRGLRFGEVKEVSPAERDTYLPIDGLSAMGCSSALRQVLDDLKRFVQTSPGFDSLDLSSYFFYADWDREWELRTLNVRYGSGQFIALHHTRSTQNSADRYIGYWDPASGAWQGWYRVP